MIKAAQYMLLVPVTITTCRHVAQQRGRLGHVHICMPVGTHTEGPLRIRLEDERSPWEPGAILLSSLWNEHVISDKFSPEELWAEADVDSDGLGSNFSLVGISDLNSCPAHMYEQE